jgi:hypothetical protein
LALDQPAVTALTITVFAAFGMMAGAIHFLSLRKDAAVLVSGGPVLGALGWRVVRVTVTIGTLVGAATQGAPALLTAAGGFLLGRHLVLRRVERWS